MLLIVMKEDCLSCIKLMNTNIFNQLLATLDLDLNKKNITYKIIHPNGCDGPRYEFHQQVMQFTPMFVMVPTDKYLDHENVSTEQLMEYIEVFNGIIENGIISPNQYNQKLYTHNNLLRFITRYSPTNYANTDVTHICFIFCLIMSIGA